VPLTSSSVPQSVSNFQLCDNGEQSKLTETIFDFDTTQKTAKKSFLPDQLINEQANIYNLEQLIQKNHYAPKVEAETLVIKPRRVGRPQKIRK
jgi:hypothetical protein